MTAPLDPDAVSSGSTGSTGRPDDEPDLEPGDDIVLPWWQNPKNIVTMLVTIALIAGMLGWLIGESGNDVESSDVDTGFLQDMRVHHEQAIQIGNLYLDRPDIDRGLATVADGIVLGQAIEIGIMIELLRDMDAPTESEEGQAMAWMGMPMADTDMPGLASEEQLQELAGSSGTDADRMFVELMVAHHQGGIDMANEAAERAENADVRRYAAAWAHGQADEIAELESLLPGQ